MGESFKLHSQSLIGYEEAMMAEHAHGTPDVIAPAHSAEVTAY